MLEYTTKPNTTRTEKEIPLRSCLQIMSGECPLLRSGTFPCCESFVHLGEQGGGQIALARVGKDDDDVLAGVFRTCRQLCGGGECCTG